MIWLVVLVGLAQNRLSVWSGLSLMYGGECRLTVPHLCETTTFPIGGSIDANQCSVARVVVNVLSNVYTTTSSEVLVTERGVNLMQ